MPICHLGGPPFTSSSPNPIGKDGIAGPDITDIERAVRIGNESAGGIAVVKGSIVITGVVRIWHVNCRVNDWDVVASTGV